MAVPPEVTNMQHGRMASFFGSKNRILPTVVAMQQLLPPFSSA
jgi:hypothetical protein